MEHLDMEKLREAYKDWGISHLTGIPLINVDVTGERDKLS